ncbi:MAG: DUF4411 family protein [Alphaproteobacteria bacterium]
MYLLDSNVFIQAKNFCYGFKICPGFWQWLDRASNDKVYSIDGVYKELVDGKDELSKWVKERKKRFLG